MDDRDRRFIRLCEEYTERLVRDLMRFGRREQDARDIAQETLLAMWKRLDHVQPRAEWVYLRTAAHRRAITQHERDRDAAHAALGHLVDSKPDERRRADTRLVDREEAARFRSSFDAAFAELPADTRLYLVLRRRGMKPRDIARQLSVTGDVVRSALKRAFKFLRERVGPPPPGVEWAELTGENDDDHQE